MDKMPNIKVQNWGLGLLLGIILLIIGLILLSSPIFTTIASVFVFGVLLVFAGIMHAVSALIDRAATHRWLYLMLAVFTFVVGILMLFNPGATMMTLTLLIAAYFLASGLFRIIGSLSTRFSGWMWYLINGVISILLGILILFHWPSASLWVIGLFVGIDILIAGLTLIFISLFIKRKAFFT